ncbi:uncharacterized protein [Rhodnius prolixus]|uniref:uncharacterized protein n=1 Tax=Rhodnius prolixus TaxID=13249 RepID=UPI003D18B618
MYKLLGGVQFGGTLRSLLQLNSAGRTRSKWISMKKKSLILDFAIHWQFLSFTIHRCLDIGCLRSTHCCCVHAAGFRGARVDSNCPFHCNTWHSIDFWMGIDSTSVDGNTCKDNCTKVARGIPFENCTGSEQERILLSGRLH